MSNGSGYNPMVYPYGGSELTHGQYPNSNTTLTYNIGCGNSFNIHIDNSFNPVGLAGKFLLGAIGIPCLAFTIISFQEVPVPQDRIIFNVQEDKAYIPGSMIQRGQSASDQNIHFPVFPVDANPLDLDALDIISSDHHKLSGKIKFTYRVNMGLLESSDIQEIHSLVAQYPDQCRYESGVWMALMIDFNKQANKQVPCLPINLAGKLVAEDFLNNKNIGDKKEIESYFRNQVNNVLNKERLPVEILSVESEDVKLKTKFLGLWF
jgi:hypothetical protein